MIDNLQKIRLKNYIKNYEIINQDLISKHDR